MGNDSQSTGPRNHRGAREPSALAAWEQIVPATVKLNGDRVVYRTAGRGPVLLLVHGMAGSATTWKRVMAPLARRFTVVAPDLLGQGESDRPRSEYSLGAHANMLRDLLDVLGHERVNLIGQSLGGGVAMQFAHQFPERCERLVLVDSGGLGRDVSVILRALTLPGAGVLLRLASAPAARVVATGLHVGLARTRIGASPAAEEIWRSFDSLADPDRRHAFFRSLRDVIDWSGQAVSALSYLENDTQLPLLIMWGARDPFVPVRHALDTHRLVPGSRVMIFDDVGHYPHCEAPEQFVDAVVDFVASTRPARLPPRSPSPHREARRERRP